MSYKIKVKDAFGRKWADLDKRKYATYERAKNKKINLENEWENEFKIVKTKDKSGSGVLVHLDKKSRGVQN